MKGRTRVLAVFAMALLLLAAIAVPVVALTMAKPVMTGELALYTKDPTTPSGPWTIITGPHVASGMMDFKLYADGSMKYQFCGSNLARSTAYTLVNYAGWPNVNIIASGTTNKCGKICLKGTDTTPLVSDNDPVAPGAKIWLVPTAQLSGTAFVSWDPTKILFEGIGMPIAEH